MLAYPRRLAYWFSLLEREKEESMRKRITLEEVLRAWEEFPPVGGFPIPIHILELPVPSEVRGVIGKFPCPTYILAVNEFVGLLAVWDYESLREEYSRFGESFSKEDLLILILRLKGLIGDWIHEWEGFEPERFFSEKDPPEYPFPFPFNHIVLWDGGWEGHDLVLFGDDLKHLFWEASHRALRRTVFQLAPVRYKLEMLNKAVSNLAGFRVGREPI